MKVLTHIDPLSTTKIAALLGILWAVLGWFMSSIVIALVMQGSTPEELANIPPIFSLGGLVSGIIGGFVGGGVSGYLGSLVYNLLAGRIGGIKVTMEETVG